MFGGGFAGRQVPMRGQPQGAGVPMAGPAGAAPAGKPLGVVPQGAATPTQGFPNAPLIPPTKVPMGAKKDCPICRG